jgi:hypothetical protein
MPSSLDLQVLDQTTALSDAELPRPGDFISSKKRLPSYPSDKCYLVVLQSGYVSPGSPPSVFGQSGARGLGLHQHELIVKALDIETPGKVLSEFCIFM